jgi:pyruvate ferredoxin oxidoreductase beta subunit
MTIEEIATIKQMPSNDYFLSGHGACPGCGVAIAVKNIMRILGSDTTVYVPASCLIVFSALYPTSSFRTPLLFTAFENTGAVITGIKAAQKRRGIKGTVVGIAGDGGTFDIGLQALSGAAERHEDVLYVCVDNEAYMNTGIQRSGSTPFGAWTTTTPIGKKVQGKRQMKKDVMDLVIAHNPEYAATLSIAHYNDFIRKVEKAKNKSGFRFLHVLTPCIPGWRTESSKSVEIAKLAVETGMWTLFEFEDGEARSTYRPQIMKPVTEYLQLQGRFRHMNSEDLNTLQRWLCNKWYYHYGHEVEQPACVIYSGEKELHFDGDPLHGV